MVNEGIYHNIETSATLPSSSITNDLPVSSSVITPMSHIVSYIYVSWSMYTCVCWCVYTCVSSVTKHEYPCVSTPECPGVTKHGSPYVSTPGCPGVTTPEDPWVSTPGCPCVTTPESHMCLHLGVLVLLHLSFLCVYIWVSWCYYT